MAINFNGVERLIEITDPSDTSVDVGLDLYSAWKNWVRQENNSGYAAAFRAFGGDPTATGQTAPKYYFLQNYWRVYVDNGQVVEVALNLYSDDYISPYTVQPGSGISSRNSDAVNVNEEDIRDQSYALARVYINTNVGESGQNYPLGTPPRPVNNFGDANYIADARNLTSFDLNTGFSPLILDGSEDLSFHSFYGVSANTARLYLNSNNTQGSFFDKILLLGTMSGNSTINGGAVSDLSGFQGAMNRVGFNGTITLDSGSTQSISLLECYSVVPGESRPVLDCNNISQNINIRRYTGGLTLMNVTQNINISFDGFSSTLEIHPSCTTGSINVGGDVYIVDTNHGMTVSTARKSSNIVANAVWGGDVSLFLSGSAGNVLKSARDWAELNNRNPF